ncbi:DoxX family protein [bacterium SCSIO 12696]|nr:DoxX family protein [bacterium SCSIO 12696]
MNKLFSLHNGFMNGASKVDFLAPLLFRVYLAPVMIQAGWNKLDGWQGTVSWFGNADWGLGLPMPELMAALAIGAELIGGIMLLIGLATRVVAIPLMVTMLVAIFAVHWENGWLAVSDSSSWLANDRVMEAAERKDAIKSILRQHGNYSWLTGRGSVTILNNGIEFAATYFIMLLSLMFTGGGRYASADYWLCKVFCKEQK